MATIKLGTRPENFKPFPVKFTLPDGSEGVIVATYKYRTRAEFGQMLNAMFAEAEPKTAGEKIDFELLFMETSEKNADHLLNSLTAWDVDAPLNAESLQTLANEFPGASAALMSAYSAACNEGRLGN